MNYRGAGSPDYAVFGTVIAGMTEVDAISEVPVASIANSGLTSFPYPLVSIDSVKHTRLDTDGVIGQTYRIYKAAFDRNPDPSARGF